MGGFYLPDGGGHALVRVEKKNPLSRQSTCLRSVGLTCVLWCGSVRGWPRDWRGFLGLVIISFEHNAQGADLGFEIWLFKIF